MLDHLLQAALVLIVYNIQPQIPTALGKVLELFSTVRSREHTHSALDRESGRDSVLPPEMCTVHPRRHHHESLLSLVHDGRHRGADHRASRAGPPPAGYPDISAAAGPALVLLDDQAQLNNTNDLVVDLERGHRGLQELDRLEGRAVRPLLLL